MDNEKEFKIPLDSPLDVSVGDQPVLASAPKFSFNRQKLIGGLLQNSVRYEADGYAAGWHIYNFDYIALGDYYLNPNDLGQLNIGKGIFERAPRDYWKVRLKDAGLAFHWNFQTQWTSWLEGSGTLTRVGDRIARFTGTTSAITPTTFSIDCDLYTGAMIPGTFTSSNSALVPSAQQLSGYNKLVVEVPSQYGVNYLKIRYGKPYSSITTYQYTGSKHIWSDTAEYNGTTLTLLKPGGYVLTSFNTLNVGTENEVIRVLMSLLVTFTEVITSSYDMKPIRNWHIEDNWTPTEKKPITFLRVATASSNSNDIIDVVNFISATFVKCISPANTAPIYITSPTKLSSDAVSSHSISIPVWVYMDTALEFWTSRVWIPPVYATDSNGNIIYDPITGNPIILIPGYYLYYLNFKFGTTTAKLQDNALAYIGAHGSVSNVVTDFTSTAQVQIQSTATDHDISIWFYNSNTAVGVGQISGKLNFKLTVDFNSGELTIDNTKTANYPFITWNNGTGLGTPSLNMISMSTWQIESIGAGSLIIRPRMQKYLWTFYKSAGWNVHGKMVYRLPLCINSWSYFDVKTMDIVNGVWDIVLTPSTGKLRWDSLGLNIAELTFQNALTEVVPPQTTKLDAFIAFKLSFFTPLLAANCTQFGVTGESDSQGNVIITDYNYYVPKWIFDAMGSIPGTYNGIFGYSKTLYDFYVMIYIQAAEQIKSQFTVTGSHSPNETLALTDDNTIRTQLRTGTFSPLVSGVFTQSFNFPVSGTTGVSGTINIANGNITVTQNITGYTYVSFVKTKKNSEYIWTLKLTKNYLGIEMLLYRCFRLSSAGILANVNVTSVNTDGTINLTTGYGSIKGNTYTNHPQVSLESLQTNTNYLVLYAKPENRAEVEYLVAGLFWRNDPRIQYINHTATQLIFLFNGTQYTLTVNSAKEQLVYQATDLRTNEQREIWRQTCDKTTIFKKQFWSNDVGVENFWWIDQDHVLELSKYYFTLYEKTNQLDDWAGNRWDILQRGPRGTFLDDRDTYWTVSWAWETKGIFLKMRPIKDAIEILYIGDMTTVDWSMPLDLDTKFTKVTVPVTKVAIGTLSTTAISAFVPLDPAGLIVQAKITTTAIAGYLLIGIRVTRGLLQWTLKIQGGTCTVFNGYGSVGINGTLTGNQLPVNYCGADGFKGTCTDLKEFKSTTKDENNFDGLELTDVIYSDGSNLWFVSKQITNIVTHFTFNAGTWSPVPLALNNNFTSDLVFEHWPMCKVTADLVPQAYNYLGLIIPDVGDGGAMNALDAFFNTLSGAVIPSVWLMTPLIIMSIGALAASGQAAVVQRNSSGVRLKDGKDDASIQIKSRTRQETEQIITRNLESIYQLLIAVGLTALPVMSEMQEKLNAGQDSSEVIDTAGRRLGNAIITELPQLISGLKTSGFGAEVSAVASEFLSLNMFYHIGDSIECWSGPGFVNHNFREQIVVQSMDNYQCSWLRARLVVPFKIITSLLAKAQVATYTLAADLLEKLADYSKELTIFGGINIGAVISATAIAAGFLVRKAAAFAEGLAEPEAVTALYQSFGANELKMTWPGDIHGRQINFEPQHTFGDKPYSLFYPSVKESSSDKLQQTSVSIDFQRKKHSVDLVSGTGAITVQQNLDSAGKNAGAAKAGQDAELEIPYAVTVIKNLDVAVKDMTLVEGITQLLPDTVDYKNQQINVPFPQFGVPPIMDYPIMTSTYKMWFNASMGEILSVGVGDTKVIDGPPSNVVTFPQFLGIASSYTAIECGEFDPDYLRPVALTADSIGLNITGYNSVHDARAYHAFDNQFNRIVSWKGGTGLDNAFLVRQYGFIINNYFKRSNIVPPSEFYGKFDSTPEQAYEAYGERLYNFVTRVDVNGDLPFNVSGEDRDSRRYAIPVHSDILQTLPATMRTIAPYPLAVMDGVTSLTTELRNANPAGKAPTSIDFNIFDDTYRMTDEYIGKVVRKNGLLKSDYVTAAAGLTLLGPTTKEAYLYAPATKDYFTFGGGQEVTKKDTLSRFISTEDGRYDFINQEVVLRSLVDKNILVDDVSGYMVLRLDGDIRGELYPPPKTIYNERSGFKTYSFYGGFTYQGPKRCIVNRFIETEMMDQQVRDNMRRWKKLSRYEWPVPRDYGWEYVDWHTDTPINAVYGWTHNPHRAATAMLMVDDKTDCVFEWELLFAWSDVMERLWKQNEFITINLAAETIGEGGKLLSDPTHIYLYKELFKSGYYSMRYQGKNGMGNRERLYIWGDGLIALQDLRLFCKELTSKRSQVLATAQIDVQELSEQ